MQLLGIPPHERIPDEQPSCLVRGPAIQKARERIGFDIGNWHQMEWYINLVRLDFENVSDGDFQNTQEEVVGIVRALANHSNPPLLRRNELTELQKEIRKSLDQLINFGSLSLGPFSYKVMVYRPSYMTDKFFPDRKKTASQATLDLPELLAHRILVKGETGGKGVTHYLLSHFADLLGLYGHRIFPCPKCEKIFLQFRSHAKFCSRECQSRAAMEASRQKKKAKTKIRPKQPQKSKTKKGK